MIIDLPEEIILLILKRFHRFKYLYNLYQVNLFFKKKTTIILNYHYNKIDNYLNSTNLKKNIKFIVDSNPIYHNKKKFNLNVMSPQKIKNEKFDKILITSRAFSKDIYKTLIKLGVAKNKIIKL